EVRMIRRIGEVLRFQRQGGAELVNAAHAVNGSVQKVARVELNTGLVCEDLHHAARFRVFHFGGQRRSAGLVVQHEVLIVAVGEFQLFVGGPDTAADDHRGSEVERSAGYGSDLTGRNQRLVHGCVVVCGQHDLVVQN